MAIKIFTNLLKNIKKCLRLFNKNTFLCWTRFTTPNLLATAKQLIRKNSVCCLKNQVIFFHRANMQIGLIPLPLSFSFAF